MHHTLIENCYFRSENYGSCVYLTGFGVARLVGCYTYGGNIGFLVAQRTENTATTFESCWAMNFKSTGYNLVGVYYTSLIACAADSTFTDSNNYWVPIGYLFNNCFSVSAVNCGTEQQVIGIAVYDSHNISFSGWALLTRADAIGVRVYSINAASELSLENFHIRRSGDAISGSNDVLVPGGTKIRFSNTGRTYPIDTAPWISETQPILLNGQDTLTNGGMDDYVAIPK